MVSKIRRAGCSALLDGLDVAFESRHCTRNLWRRRAPLSHLKIAPVACGGQTMRCSRRRHKFRRANLGRALIIFASARRCAPRSRSACDATRNIQR